MLYILDLVYVYFVNNVKKKKQKDVCNRIHKNVKKI